MRQDCVRGDRGRNHFRRLRVSGERYGADPDKNEWSHVGDALGYVGTRLFGVGMLMPRNTSLQWMSSDGTLNDPQPQPRDRGALTVRSNQAPVAGHVTCVATRSVGRWTLWTKRLAAVGARGPAMLPDNIAALSVRGFLEKHKRLRQGQPEHLAVADAAAGVVRFTIASLQQESIRLPAASGYSCRCHTSVRRRHFQPPPQFGPVGHRWRTSAKVLRLTAHLEPREGLAA